MSLLFSQFYSENVEPFESSSVVFFYHYLHQLASYFIKLSKIRIQQRVQRKMVTGNEMIVLSPIDACMPRFLSAGPMLHEFDSLATVIFI